MKQLNYLLLALSLVSVTVAAQSPPPRPPSISSPDVHPDHSITFRYFSRRAQKVTLSGEFLSAPVPLKKDTSGIWSVTVPPVKPDIYPYSFTVDTVQTADPNNTYIFANE